MNDEQRARAIAKLQSYRQQAAKNRNFANSPTGPKKGYFASYPPEVQRKCWEMLSALRIKHGDKVQGSRIGMYVATATRMALDALGITKTSRNGFHRIRLINKQQVALGIRIPNPELAAHNRRKSRAKATARMQERDLSQIPD